MTSQPRRRLSHREYPHRRRMNVTNDIKKQKNIEKYFFFLFSRMQSLSLSTSTKIGYEDHFAKLEHQASFADPALETHAFWTSDRHFARDGLFLKAKIRALNKIFALISWLLWLDKTLGQVFAILLIKIKFDLQRFSRRKNGQPANISLHMVRNNQRSYWSNELKIWPKNDEYKKCVSYCWGKLNFDVNW